MNILVTGYAGFIGSQLIKKLLIDPKIKKIYGVDNFNSYYEKSLKNNRVKDLRLNDLNKKLIEFNFDISNSNKINSTFKKINLDAVIHLAAQAGIRYSFTNPQSYIKSNIIGFFNILELIKINKIPKLIFASTSSAYGNQIKTPFKENYMNNSPLQLYAATKISNEVMAHSYSHLYGFTSIGLRFFTVYGPWGRPDMAIYKFTDLIHNKKNIELYGAGKMLRDCTYIDDIVLGIIKTLKKKSSNFANSKKINHSIFNIGYGKPISVKIILKKIENNIGKKAIITLFPKHNSEMKKTYCSTKKFNKVFNFSPKINIDDGLKKFNEWYNSYYKK